MQKKTMNSFLLFCLENMSPKSVCSQKPWEKYYRGGLGIN